MRHYKRGTRYALEKEAVGGRQLGEGRSWRRQELWATDLLGVGLRAFWVKLLMLCSCRHKGIDIMGWDVLSN